MRLLPLALLVACAHAPPPWEGPPPLQPFREVVGGRTLAEGEKPLVVHVVGQLHAPPISTPEGDEAARPRVERCQRTLVSTALANAGQGARAIVLEGELAWGDAEEPKQMPRFVAARSRMFLAAQELIFRPEVVPYGMEHGGLMGHAMLARVVANTAIGPDGNIDRKQMDREVQAYGMVVVVRGTVALAIAIGAASQRKEDAVQILIGAHHLGDLERLVREFGPYSSPIKLLLYACPEAMH